MKKILTLGSAMRDLFICYDTADTLSLSSGIQQEAFLVLKEGKKIEISSIDKHVGGGAINSATACVRLKNQVTLLAKIGSDSDGEAIISHLKQESIDTSNIITSTMHETGVSLIFPCPSGNRTILIDRGANGFLEQSNITPSLFESINGLYITSLSNNSSHILPAITKMARSRVGYIALNPGSTQLSTHLQSVLDALPFIDILILNSSEAFLLLSNIDAAQKCAPQIHGSTKQCPMLMKASAIRQDTCFNLRTFFKEIALHGPKIMVVTNGAEGVYASDLQQIYFHPSIPTNIKSTVGAGDAFGATFFSFLLNGYPLETALRAGIVNSSSVIQHVGPQTGLLTVEAILSQLACLDQSMLQIFE